MGINTFNMHGVFTVQIPDYFETHYKGEDEELSQFFVAMYHPQDSEWEHFGTAEQGIGVSRQFHGGHEGVDYSGNQLQEVILTKMRWVLQQAQTAMLQATGGLLKSFVLDPADDTPYIYNSEKDFIIVITERANDYSTVSAHLEINDGTSYEFTISDNRDVSPDQRKKFVCDFLDSIKLGTEKSQMLTGSKGKRKSKKTSSDSIKKEKAGKCPIPEDNRDYRTVSDRDFTPDSILAQSAAAYLIRSYNKIDHHFSTPYSDKELGNDLFLDLVNVVDYMDYQRNVSISINNDPFPKGLILYTIRDFFSQIRQSNKVDHEKILSGYCGIFIDMLRFLYSNDSITNKNQLLRGLGTLGIRYEKTICSDVAELCRNKQQTQSDRLIAARKWLTKICNTLDNRLLFSENQVNPLLFFKLICDDVLYFKENQFEWDSQQRKHIINAVEINRDILWNCPEALFLINKTYSLGSSYLNSLETKGLDITSTDNKRKCPWNEIGAWTPFTLFYAAADAQISMSYDEKGNVFIYTTELLKPFEKYLKKLLTDVKASNRVTFLSSRKEVQDHNIKWGMIVPDDGFCNGEKLIINTREVLSGYENVKIDRIIAFAYPNPGRIKLNHNGEAGWMNSGGIHFGKLDSVSFDNDDNDKYDVPSITIQDKVNNNLKSVKPFSEVKVALSNAQLFRVDKSLFDSTSDWECEIRNGYIREGRMLSTFRSFAWSLASLLFDQNKSFAKVKKDDVLTVVKTIEERDCLNYAEDSYFPEICSICDRYGIYTDLDSKDAKLISAFSSIEQSEHDTVYCSGSLSELRRELKLLLPAINIIEKEAINIKKKEKKLEGTIANILCCWCVMTIAAEGNIISASTGRLMMSWEQFNDWNWYVDTRSPSQIIGKKPIAWFPIIEEKIGNVVENANEVLSSDGNFILNGDILVKYQGTDCVVNVPDGITEIQSRAFFKKNFITEINLPNSLEKIGDSGFNSCEKLEHIIIPDSVKSIGNFAFGNCKSLVSVKFPSSLEYLGKNAFAECKKLEKAEIKGNITAIEEGTFKSCSSLKKVQMPDTVIKIGTMCFWWCFELEDIVLSNNLEKINNSAFDSCGKLKAINFPPSLRELDIHIFMRTGLESVKILENTKKIGNGCFYDCKNLKTAEILGPIKIVPERLFSGCPITNFKVPEGVQTIGKDAFKGGYNSETKTSFNLNTIYIPESVIKIDEEAFSSYSGLTVHCTKGSYAEQFALNHGCKIVTIQNDNSAIIQESQLDKNDVKDSSELEPTINNKQSTIDNLVETIPNTKELSSTLSQFSEPSIMEIEIFDWKAENEQDVRAISSEACKNGLDLTWLYFILRNEWALGVLNTSGDEFWRVNQKYFPNIQHETLMLRRQQAMPWLNDPNTYNNQFRMLYGTSFDQRYTMLVRQFMDRINPTDPWQHVNNAFNWLRNFFTPQEQQILWNRLCEEINNKKSYILDQLSGLNDDFTVFDTAKQYLILLLETPVPEKIDRDNPYNYLAQEACIRVGLYDSSKMGMFVPLITTQAWIWNTTLDEIYRAAVRNIQDQRPGKSDGKKLIRRLLPQYLY